MPRTPWGDPDLQGTYTNRREADTPLERPEAFAGRQHDEVTRDDIAAFRRAAAADQRKINIGAEWPLEGDEAAGQRAWLIVDPPDGRMPPQTAEGAQRSAASTAARRARPRADSYADRDIFVRCITRGLVTSMLPTQDGSYEIVQAPGYVAIRHEVIHETRMIPLDAGRPNVIAAVGRDMGDSRGRWDGDTLVVETANISERSAAAFAGALGRTLRVTERFTPESSTRLRWTVTVDDPSTWKRPWSFVVPLTRTSGEAIYEYACHEGNYAMRNILSAARADERRWWGLRGVAVDALGPLRGIGRPWAMAAGLLTLVCGGAALFVGIRRVRGRRSKV